MDIAEIKAMMMAGVDEAFNKLDVNGDGAVVLTEMQQVLMDDKTFEFPPQIAN